MRSHALAILTSLIVLSTGCSVVTSPWDGQEVAATNTPIAFTGYLQSASAPVYLQVATVDAPVYTNPAHWAFIHPATGGISPTPIALATTASAATGTFDGMTGYKWTRTITVNAGWRAGGVGSIARFVIRTAGDWNATFPSASDSVICATITAEYPGGTPTLRCTYGNGSSATATNMDDAQARFRSGASPTISVSTTGYHALGSACQVAGKLGACATGAYDAPGHCAQKVFPQAESCTNMMKDDDCNGTMDDIAGLNTACDATPIGCQDGFVVPGDGRMQCSNNQLRCVPKSANATAGASFDPLRISASNPTGAYCSALSSADRPDLCGAVGGEICVGYPGGDVPANSRNLACQPGTGCFYAQGLSTGLGRETFTCQSQVLETSTNHVFEVCDQTLFSTRYPANVPTCWLPSAVSGFHAEAYACCDVTTSDCDIVTID